MENPQVVCQVCKEKIIWLIERWVHNSSQESKKEGHFAWPEADFTHELFEPKPEGSEVAFW